MSLADFGLPLEPLTLRGIVYRQCLRAIELCPPQAAAVRHEWGNPGCDCLRRPVPVKHQAKSSGALGTPDRNHDCPECDGAGKVALGWIGNMAHHVMCARCGGSGELRADGSPGGGA